MSDLDRTSQSGPLVQSATQGDCINLRLGQPSPELLPLAELHRAAATALAPGRDRLILQYGACPGHLSFREHLATVLGRELGRTVKPETLIVTSGNSQALGMVSTMLAKPGAVVICEDPTYFLARGIFHDHQLEVHGIPVDEQGLCVDLLESRLQRAQLRPAFVYCIPNHQNPTGVSLDQERARRLLQLADEHGFYVVCDNPYGLLWFGERPPAPFANELGRHPRLLDLGSFSKILGPGLRLGWIEASEQVCRQLGGYGVLRSGGALNPLVSAIVEPCLVAGDDGTEPFLVRHVRTLRTIFAERAATLVDRLRRHLPQIRTTSPQGGYFVWLDLGQVDGRDFNQLATQEQVSFLPGTECAVEARLDHHARLSFAFYRSDELELAAHRLGRAWSQL